METPAGYGRPSGWIWSFSGWIWSSLRLDMVVARLDMVVPRLDMVVLRLDMVVLPAGYGRFFDGLIFGTASTV